MTYNVIFVLQHFVLYPKNGRKRVKSDSTDIVVKLERLSATINPYKSKSILHRVQDM